MTVPPFPLVSDPGDWPELVLVAATVLLEAEGEPESGQMAVAHVISNRAEAGESPVRTVILGPDGRAWGDGRDYEPFSCWNQDAEARARARLASAPETSAARAWKAAAAGYWRLTPDPSHGAFFYLNVELTRRLRGGTLPDWFREEKVTTAYGRHTFMRA